MATIEQNSYVQDHIFNPYGGAGQYGFGSANVPTNIPTNTQQYQVVGHSAPYGQPFGTGPTPPPQQQRLQHHTAEQHQEFQPMSHRIQQQQGLRRDQQNMVRNGLRQQGQKGMQMKTTGYGFQEQQQSPTLPTGSLNGSNPTRQLGMPVVMSQEQQLRRQPTQQTTPPPAHQLQQQHQIPPQQQHQQLQQQQGQLQQHQQQHQLGSHQLQLQHQLSQRQIHPIKHQQQTHLPQQQILPVQNVPSFRHQQEHEQNLQQQQQLQEQRIKQDQQQRAQQEHLRQQQQQQQQQHLERRHSEQQLKQHNYHQQPQRHPQFQNPQLQHQRSLQQISRSPPQLHAPTPPPPAPEHITTPPPRTAEISALAGTLATVGTSKVQSPNTEVDFKTDVDNLMKAIQAKVPRAPTIKGEKSHSPSPYTSPKPFQTPQQVFARFQQEVSPPLGLGEGERMLAASGPPPDTKEPEKKSPKQRKRYECTVPGCAKAFFQRTHLDIHSRAHTGDKPFHCSEAGCGQRFSQLGNLKTHERRHTGEKPYSCDICGKRFAQRGNVRAHKISHQNKFHAHALRELTEKFMSIRNPEDIAPSDRGLFEYFADLYKNSNRGIKGRGKDRKIRNVRDFSSDNGGNGNTITSPGSISTTSGGDNYGVYSGGAMDEDEEETGGYDGRQQQQQQMQQQQLPSISRNMISYNY
ncbi:Similar to Asparagine-rich zinc finger protein AZF1; acc. no. P41696 [Pyronema omphalodes CBS 100304]|uniref:Similar to Asparagine-rich zinc finger protein AZF1 acc. no. P41696 n=1 Tax=Pyronema omphalodes (strain CBS 100304) TaxID=1076935 RepID=U4L5A9_PYROM|nr:Similar to Asparagine-rich zinc finger protein AZF1; acc. no. P41696 [Pyronema omphalodes CBS 100304]